MLGQTLYYSIYTPLVVSAGNKVLPGFTTRVATDTWPLLDTLHCDKNNFTEKLHLYFKIYQERKYFV